MKHEDLSTLPVEDGFRLRGLATTRIEAFTDAALAFSVTLLVITNGALPTSIDEMLFALRRIPAFAGAFALLMVFWSAHNSWSRCYGLDDSRSRVLSIGLVFTVLVFVYPLRIVSSSFFYALTGGWCPLDIRSTGTSDLQDIFAVYSAGYLALCTFVLLLHKHALAKADTLRLDALERHDTRTAVIAWQIQVVTAIVSLAVATLRDPPAGASMLGHGLPGFVYASLGITMPYLHRSRAKPRAALLALRS